MPPNEAVRRLLTKAIANRRGLINDYTRDAVRLLGERAVIHRKRDAIQAELNEMVEHLDSIGGPVETEQGEER